MVSEEQAKLANAAVNLLRDAGLPHLAQMVIDQIYLRQHHARGMEYKRLKLIKGVNDETDIFN